jgi:hypothetical protein
MKFNIFEKSDQAVGGGKKRLLKSSHKTLKYQSTNFNPDSKAKNQSSDYYVGIYDEAKDKCYLLPVSAAY